MKQIIVFIILFLFCINFVSAITVEIPNSEVKRIDEKIYVNNLKNISYEETIVFTPTASLINSVSIYMPKEDSNIIFESKNLECYIYMNSTGKNDNVQNIYYDTQIKDEINKNEIIFNLPFHPIYINEYPIDCILTFKIIDLNGIIDDGKLAKLPLNMYSRENVLDSSITVYLNDNFEYDVIPENFKPENNAENYEIVSFSPMANETKTFRDIIYLKISMRNSKTAEDPFWDFENMKKASWFIPSILGILGLSVIGIIVFIMNIFKKKDEKKSQLKKNFDFKCFFGKLFQFGKVVRYTEGETTTKIINYEGINCEVEYYPYPSKKKEILSVKFLCPKCDTELVYNNLGSSLDCPVKKCNYSKYIPIYEGINKLEEKVKKIAYKEIYRNPSQTKQ